MLGVAPRILSTKHYGHSVSFRSDRHMESRSLRDSPAIQPGARVLSLLARWLSFLGASIHSPNLAIPLSDHRVWRASDGSRRRVSAGPSVTARGGAAPYYPPPMRFFSPSCAGTS